MPGAIGDQKSTKIALSLFCAGIYCWPEVWLVYPHETPLERTNCSFVSNCQLEIASRLWVGANVHFPTSVLATPSGLKLSRPL